MVTLKQQGAVKDISEKLGKGQVPAIGQIMRDNGYSEITSLTPKNLTESKGYKEELAKYGLTEELITTALVEDINKKKGNRVSELNLGARILKMDSLDDKRGGDVQINILNFNAGNNPV